jgi:hypothetical protein
MRALWLPADYEFMLKRIFIFSVSLDLLKHHALDKLHPLIKFQKEIRF